MQREAVVAILDVRLAGHGIKVGLQGQLQVVLARLHLIENRRNISNKSEYKLLFLLYS